MQLNYDDLEAYEIISYFTKIFILYSYFCIILPISSHQSSSNLFSVNGVVSNMISSESLFFANFMTILLDDQRVFLL